MVTPSGSDPLRVSRYFLSFFCSIIIESVLLGDFGKENAIEEEQQEGGFVFTCIGEK